jgi:hypothetical protein
MGVAERDSTAEWLLPEHSRPPLIRDLEARVEEALATARASESAVMAVGEAALDAAEEARRAAELAERASAAVFTGRGVSPAGGEQGGGGPPTAAGEEPGSLSAVEDEDQSLRDFTARADRIAARLRELEQGSLTQFG